MFKKVALIAVAVVSGLGLQACTDQEVATGVVIVGAAVVAGALVAGAASGGRSSSYDRPSYGPSHGGYDRGGFDHGGSYGRGPGGPGGFGRHLLAGQDQRVAALAQKYDLSAKASASVVAAFDIAQTGNLDGFAQVGLSKDELQHLGTGQLPSQETLARLSANLKTSQASLENLLQDVANQAIVESSKWMNAATPVGAN